MRKLVLRRAPTLTAVGLAVGAAALLLTAPAVAGWRDVELAEGAQWRPQASELDGTDLTLRAVSCADGAHCTAVGAFGVILATDDGGASWHVERPPQGRGSHSTEVTTLFDVSCPRREHCVAVGEQGTIMATHDGGTTWASQDSGVALHLNSVSCVNPSHCVAMGGPRDPTMLPPNSLAVLTTDDGGETWVRQPGTENAGAPGVGYGETGIPTLALSCAEPLGGSAPQSQDLLAHCQAGGHDVNTVFTTTGRIFASKTGGRTWTPGTDLPGTIPQSVSCVDARVCYAATAGGPLPGVVLKTVDGGASWAPVAPTSTEEDELFIGPLHGIACGDADHCITVGGRIDAYNNDTWRQLNAGTILATDDGGENWQEHESGTRAVLLDVACPSTEVCVAVGAEGVIVASDDGGATWTRQHAGNLNDLAVTDARHAHAVGAGGLIVATADRGASWTRQESDTSMDLNGVAFADAEGCPATQPACHGWAVGHAGTILATTDGGHTWAQQHAATDQGAATQTDLTDIACVDAQHCWATGRTPHHGSAAPTTIVATDDGGQTWTAQHTGEPGDDLFAIACPSSDTCYAAGGPLPLTYDGSGPPLVLATNDGGDTWTELDTPDGRPLTALACPTDAACIAGSTHDNDDDDHVGMVMATDDGGETWSQHSLPDLDPDGKGPHAEHVRGIACADATTCRAVTGRGPYDHQYSEPGSGTPVGASRDGVVWTTEDFGASWTEQDRMARYGLTGVALDPTSEDPAAWAVGGGGAVLSTVDLPPAAVSVTAEQVGATIVELSWAAVGADGRAGNQPAQRYQIHQATSPIETEEDFETARPLCELGDCFSGDLDEIGDPVTFTVSDLDPGTTYHWGVRAVDEGRGDEDVKFGPLGTATLTLPEVAPAAVDDLTATAVSDREIELAFSAVGSDGDRPPPAEEYVVKQARGPIDDPADFAAATRLCDGVCAFEPGTVGDELSLAVGDLDAETTYHYAVRARDDAGELSALSNPAAATTLAPGETPAGEPGEIGRVDDLAATAQSDSEIALEWSAVSDSDGRAIDAYVVAQSTEPIEDTADFDEALALCGGVCDQFDLASDAVGEQLALTVGDLTPGTAYHYAIAPLAPDGQRGPISPSTSATTHGDPPPPGQDDSPTGDGGPGPTGTEDDAGVETAAEGVVRVSGADRIATAVAASREAFAAGQAEAAVVARADDFADGLAGVPLAAAENGPLLLTHSGRLDERVAGELDRVLADGARVFVLGGPAALSDPVEQQVADLGFEPVRLAGASRFETAAVIAEDGLGAPDEVLFATGGDFADAVTAGAAAARREAAVLLSAGDRLPPATTDYRDRHPATNEYAVGGPAARAVPQATALVGATRFETAAVVADELFTDPATVGVATGLAFADALSGGAHIAAYHGPMLLSGPEQLHPAAGDYLTAQATTIETAVVYGGPAALADAVANQTSAAITGES